MITHNCKPLFDRVLIMVTIPEQAPSKMGLIMPAPTQEQSIVTGTIIAVGDGRVDDTGRERIPLSVKVGDSVLFSKYGFDEVVLDEKTYFIGREDQLLAVVIDK